MVMLLSYSITNGIGAGIVTFTIIDFIIYEVNMVRYREGIIKEKPKHEVTPVTFIIFVLFMIYFLVPVM
jgi:xanthine/uracil/vitamin C permease (AzgA family)